jgi:S1-C subfamily serine protease
LHHGEVEGNELRLPILLCLILTCSIPTSSFAQVSTATDLTGYRFIRIIPPVYPDGGVDPIGLAPYLEQFLRNQGWSVLSGSEDLLSPAARQLASEALQCAVGYDTAGWGTTAIVNCADITGAPVITISGKGVAISPEGELKAALRDVAKRFQAARPRFNANRAVDILSRLPPVETFPLTETSLDAMIQEGKLRNPIEGLWASTDEMGYRLGIVSVDSGREFTVVILESPRTYIWQPGMVKGRLTRAADGHTFAARWRMADRRETTGLVTLDSNTLTLAITLDGKAIAPMTLVKLRPTVTTSSTDTYEREATATATGTAFICAPGVVATNNHVIDGAKTIELFLPQQNRSLKLQLIVSDPTNDLALLQIVGGQGTLPPALSLVDSSTIKLGSEAVVVGFPLGEALGAGHKVTSGMVSALDGLNGDPRTLQLTAPIQPGSSGSPVFDREGRVIGVATSTLDTLSAIRVAGQVPQNVNFALKSDYLALLLKRIPATGAAQPSAATPPMQVTDLVERVRASVGLIRAVR